MKIWKNTLILVASTLIAMATHAEYVYEFDEMDLEMIKSIDENLEKLKSLNTSDGIDRGEAEVILNAFYYTSLADGCGASGSIENLDGNWMAPTFSGIAAQPDSPIYINKKTGSISRNGKVLVENPKEMEFVFPAAYHKYKELHGN